MSDQMVVVHESITIHMFSWQVVNDPANRRRDIVLTTPAGKQYVLPMGVNAAQELGRQLTAPSVERAPANGSPRLQ